MQQTSVNPFCATRILRLANASRPLNVIESGAASTVTFVEAIASAGLWFRGSLSPPRTPPSRPFWWKAEPARRAIEGSIRKSVPPFGSPPIFRIDRTLRSRQAGSGAFSTRTQ